MQTHDTEESWKSCADVQEEGKDKSTILQALFQICEKSLHKWEEWESLSVKKDLDEHLEDSRYHEIIMTPVDMPPIQPPVHQLDIR